MRDIAKAAGVSIATVSRAINNPDSVTKETLEKIRKIMREYDYVPSQVARNNFNQRSNTIMFMSRELDSVFYRNLISYLSEICFQNGYSLLTCLVGNDLQKEQKFYQYCVANRCAGMIYAMGVSRTTAAFSVRHDIPVVVIDGHVNIAENYMTIRSNPAMAMNLLVEHLASLGHREIGYIGSNEIFAVSIERLACFKEALDRHGIRFASEYILTGDGIYESGVRAYHKFASMGKQPKAIIGVNDEAAIGYMQTAQQNGLAVPRDISVCGIDGLMRTGYYPLLVSVRQDVEGIAGKAFAYITMEDRPKGIREVVQEVRLLQGMSTGRPRK